jgi:hypothetical protein
VEQPLWSSRCGAAAGYLVFTLPKKAYRLKPTAAEGIAAAGYLLNGEKEKSRKGKRARRRQKEQQKQQQGTLLRPFKKLKSNS